MASRAFAFFFPQGRLGLLLVALLCGLAGGSHESAVLHNVEASWDFEGGLEGWANATAEELDCEVSAMGGEARGTIRGPRPHLDSPIIVVDASDRHYVVIRMRYQGRGTRGLVSVRSGAGAMGDTQSEPWTDSDWRTTCVARHAAACGAVTTLNDGGTACITAAGGGGACTYTAATAGGVVASCRATDEDLCARWAVGDSTSCSALSPACVYATAGGDGGGPFKSVSVPFDVDGDGQYHIHYVPIWEVYKGKVVQLRVFPVLDARSSGGSAADRAGLGAAAGGAGRVGVGDSFSIDWIKVVKAPTIFKVEGCINRYSTSHNLADPALNTSVVVHTAHAHRYSAKWEEDRSIPSGVRRGRTHLFTFQQTIGLQTSPRPYATTYNCLRGGGERVTLTGTNFGVFRPTWTQDTATVTVDGRPCTDVVMTVPQTQLQCNLPPGTRVGAAVRLANGAMPGLYDLKPYVSYAAPPPKLDTPVVANLAASSADLVWKPPSVYWDALAVTGYVVAYRALPEGIDTGTNATAAGAYAAVVLGNVTYTTVVGLKPDTLYEFRVAALSEDQDETGCVESSTAVGAAPGPRCRTDITGMPTAKRTRDQWRQLDLYGRRTLVQGGVVGTYSDAAATVRTLRVDFAFSRFDANATLVHGSEATGLVDVAGPTGSYGGQGHYGLHLVGDAGVENCNSSYACCDSFNATLTTNAKTGKPEAHGCRGASLVCSAIGAVDKHPDYLGGQASRDITTNALADGIFIGGAAILGHNATGQCGGALRLTAAQPRLTGAAWYPRRVNVREGFETTFTIRMSDPSVVCKRMNDEHTQCRSRGADGLAFVVQNQAGLALGRGGGAMGYGGIRNSLAVEMDTMFNHDMMDPFENHISVHSRGWREENSAHHTFELGSTAALVSAVPELTDGEHVVRIVYDPVFDHTALHSGAFVASPHVASFLENGNFEAGGMADWGTGMGTMTVYVNDMLSPVLIVPLNLDATLRLDSGRAWVGFTAATGQEMYQVHDVLDWSFRSLRKDPHYTPPTIGNPSSGEGAHRCIPGSPCSHP